MNLVIFKLKVLKVFNFGFNKLNIFLRRKDCSRDIGKVVSDFFNTLKVSNIACIAANWHLMQLTMVLGTF